MNAITASLVVSASQQRTFDYISDIKNLPKWAVEFCKELKVVEGKHIAVTPMGELYITYRADEKTGVIDMLSGPTEESMEANPTRVISLADNKSMFLFTLFQGPDMPDEVFQTQGESLQREFEHLKQQLENGG